MRYVLVLRLVELGRVLNEAFKRGKEWSHDRRISVAMVASSHASHHVCNFNLITVFCVNVGALFDRTGAQQSDLVNWWAERCIGRRIAHRANICDDHMAKRICFHAQEIQVDTNLCSYVGQRINSRLGDEAGNEVCGLGRLVMPIIFACFGALYSSCNKLGNIEDSHLVRVPDCHGYEVFSTFNIDKNGDSLLLGCFEGAER